MKEKVRKEKFWKNEENFSKLNSAAEILSKK